MKKYVYLVIDEDKNVVAAYDHKDVAAKLLPSIAEKIDKVVEIKKQLLNADLAVVGL